MIALGGSKLRSALGLVFRLERSQPRCWHNKKEIGAPEGREI